MDEDFTTLDKGFEKVFKTAPFRLLDLPPELWLRICELAVVKDHSKVIRVDYYTTKKSSAAIVQQPAITRTCRLLRQEALPLYYKLNTFAFGEFMACERRRWTTSFLVAWCAAIGKQKVRVMCTWCPECHSDHDAALSEKERWEEYFEDMGVSATMEKAPSAWFATVTCL